MLILPLYMIMMIKGLRRRTSRTAHQCRLIRRAPRSKHTQHTSHTPSLVGFPAPTSKEGRRKPVLGVCTLAYSSSLHSFRYQCSHWFSTNATYFPAFSAICFEILASFLSDLLHLHRPSRYLLSSDGTLSHTGY